MKTRLITFSQIIRILCAGSCFHQADLRGDLILTGVIDGNLQGGNPKGVELFVTADIEDLSRYGLGSANNGGGSDDQEFTFPAVSAARGTFITVEATAGHWKILFGEAADYTSHSMSINGDDAIEVFKNGLVIDTFGQIDVDGNGTPWEYLDSYAYRLPRSGPDGSTFVLENWTFGGPRALADKDAAQQAAIVEPIFGTYFLEGEEPPALTLTADRHVFAEDATAPAAFLTLTLNRPLEEVLTVTLSATNGIGELTLPASVEIPAGETSITFSIDARDDGELDGDQNVAVSAEAPGFATAMLTLTVTDIAEAPAVVINEIYPDTRAADPNNDGESSFDDEFIEVVNGMEIEVDLEGWSLHSYGNGTAATLRHVFPAGTVLAPGAAVVVFQGIDTSLLSPVDYGGAAVQQASTGTLFLNDHADTVTLRDPEGRPVDVVTYEDNLVQAASLNRSPEITGDVFQPHYDVEMSQGFSFSPGTRVSGIAFAGGESGLGLVIEDKQLIEPNPSGEQEVTYGIVRRSSPAGFSQPLIVTLTSSHPGEAGVPEAVVIPAGEVFADFEIASVADDAQDGDLFGIVITAAAEGYVSAEDTVDVLDAQTDTILLEAEVTELAEDGGVTEVILHLLSLESGGPFVAETDLVFTLSTDDPTEVTLPTEAIVAAGSATVSFQVTGLPDGEPENSDQVVTISATAPGFRTLPVLLTVIDVDPSLWVINEILADPPADLHGDANNDGMRDSSADEFIELVNNNAVPQDISGWQLEDNTSRRHVFPDGTTVPAGGAIVVFGGGQPSGAFGNAVVQTASSGSLGLNNDGDVLTLYDATDNIVLTLEYGADGGRDQSLVRSPDVTGELTALHSGLESAQGQLFSPGTRIDGSHFAAPVVVEKGWDLWRAEVFGTQADDEQIAGFAADPDGDGLSNLFEYAFSFDPTRPDADAFALQASASSGLSFQRPATLADGVALSYQISTDLRQWTTLAEDQYQIDEMPEEHLTRVSLTLDQELGTAPQIYGRLVVEWENTQD